MTQQPTQGTCCSGGASTRFAQEARRDGALASVAAQLPKMSAHSVFIATLEDAYLQGVVLAGELQATTAPSATPPEAAEPAAAPDGPPAQTYCRVSDIWLESAAALREHCKTDWYRYNLQRSTRSLPPVTESAFDELVDNDALKDELSGSDDDDDEEEEDASEGSSSAARPDGRVAMRDADGATFLAWRAALLPAGAVASDVPLSNLPHCLRALAALRPRPVWVVILCRGGHFAAAAFELLAPPKGSRRAEDAVKVLAHKAFHRYVTRRKAGGRQSVADAAKSIKSAGSSIRRHNEAMLSKEIRELLHSWRDTHLRAAHMVWVAAPGPANSAVLYAGSDAPLTRSDGRLRPIPFATARPTLGETTRTTLRLSRLDYISEAEAATLLPPPSATPEEQAAERARAQAAIEAAAAAEAARRQALEQEAAAAAAAQAEAEAAAAALPSELHDASAAGDADLVGKLLADGHDPTRTHISHGFRVPYDVAKSKEVRNAFRRYRALAEEQWDWGAAHVPEALTEEGEAEKEEREKAKAKEKKKKAEKARKERRKAEDGAMKEATRTLQAVADGEDVAKLEAALGAMLSLNGELEGGEGEAAQAVSAARAKLAQLKDPDWQKRRERERRAEAAEKRLGKLTPAQAAFMKGPS